MRKLVATTTALCLALSLGACGSTTSSKKSEESSSKTEQVVEDSKEENEEPKKDSSEKKQEAPKEEEPEQIVTEPTRYDVFRCDYREGITGDVQVMTIDTADFSSDYADLMPDGSFSFSVNGVDYTTKLSLDGKEKHLYSGIKDAEVTRLLFDGEKYATVGSVDIEGFYVDDYILLDMVTQANKKTVFATFYLWKHIDE